MELPSTQEIAEHMLASGRPYTVSALSLELGLSSKYVTGKFHNIHVTKKYQTIVTSKHPREIRVIDIGNRCKKKKLWFSLLQGDL